MLFLSPVDFFLKLTFSKKNLLGLPSECQTVWIQIRSDILSGLIRVQTVCKGYQQTIKVVTGGKRVNLWPLLQSLYLIYFKPLEGANV